MRVAGVYEKCRIYIESHDKSSLNKLRFPCITISRQTGTRADIIGNKLVDILNQYSHDVTEWTYFDKNLIEKVVADHHLPGILANYMDEDKVHNLKNMMNELLGNPSGWTFVRQMSETILQIARLGKAVIIGRGGNVITSKLNNAFHVRLVAPIEKRARQALEGYEFKNYQEALEFVKKEDASRKNYLKTYFLKDIEDPLLYHMVLNTAALGYEETAEIISGCVMRRFPELYYYSVND
ncbi:MAG TPA: cytidylate kinase-like family protein [Ignavibacteriaceae bacterium]|nr:cytidylate kinase-like family protein [Ignavibacteriaceae bacterium]